MSTTALTLAELDDELLAALRQHAADDAPRECCGLLVRDPAAGTLHYMRAANLYAGAAGRDRFELDPQAWELAEDFGAVVAVVHSHPNASANPSMADRVQCERTGLPWFVVGWPSGVVREVQPQGWLAPLEGREYSFGVLDCYTLVQDWYARTWGLELPDFEREEGFHERGEELYLQGLASAGFEVVQVAEPLPGDGLLMRVASRQVVNHAAVYLGDGYMLHHLYNELSRRERWDWEWQRRTVHVVRHRSRITAEAAAPAAVGDVAAGLRAAA